MFSVTSTNVKSERADFPATQDWEPNFTEEASGIFDPVPALATIGVCGARQGAAHDLEARIQRRLLSEPGMHFTNLTVRRLRNGAVCLEGVLTNAQLATSLLDIVAEIEGVSEVVNHLLICQSDEC